MGFPLHEAVHDVVLGFLLGMQIEDGEYYDEDHAETGHNYHNKVEHVLLKPGIRYLVDAVQILPPVSYLHVKQLPASFLGFPTVKGVR